MGVSAGSTSGRKDRERGQMGVSKSEGTRGCTMLPPEESEYAVEPVGEEMMMPSATASVRKRLLMYTSIIFRCGLEPRWRVTSFRA